MWYFDVRMKIQSERTTYSLSPIILSLFSLTLIQKQLPFLQEKKWHQHRSLKELSSPATELDRRHEASPVPREGFQTIGGIMALRAIGEWIVLRSIGGMRTLRAM